MKTAHIILFLAIVLLIYAGINFYLFHRTSLALSGMAGARRIVLWLLFLSIFALPLGRFGEHYCNAAFKLPVMVGSFYLSIMFYGFLTALAIDLAHLICRFFHYTPSIFAKSPSASPIYIWAAALLLTLSITFIGHYIAVHPRLHTLDIAIAKKAGPMKELSIAMVSDLHIGTVLGPSHLKEVMSVVQSVHPDMVLLVGDIFDEDLSEEIGRKTAAILSELHAPLGAWAVTGNHEYYIGIDKVVTLLKQAGIPYLQDSVVKIADAFYLVGRKDRTAERWGPAGRKRLDELLAGVDKAYPVILMDHQPRFLEAAQQNNVDLQLSGHTHNAQLWPLNLLYKRIYEKPWGFLQKGSTYFYVSCGAGTWGPLVRTNSPAEVVRIRVKFL